MPFLAVGLAPVVASLGGISFASALLASLNRSVPVDHICLMRFADAPRWIALIRASGATPQ